MNCPGPDLLIVLEEGVLPEKLAAELRTHLTTCAICRQLQADLCDNVLLEPTLEEAASLRHRVLPHPSPRPQLAQFKWLGAAAAAIAIVSILYLAWPRPRPEPVQIAIAKPPVYQLTLSRAPLRLPLSSTMVMRGQSTSGNTAYLNSLGTALKLYFQANYTESILQLSELAKLYPQAVEPPFYEGVAQLLLGNPLASIKPLEQAQGIGGEALNDDIAWYLAIARERSSRWPDAIKLLSPLCANDGPYRSAACAALGKSTTR